MKTKNLSRAALYALIAVGMASSSCSCGSPETRENNPRTVFPGLEQDAETGNYILDFGIVPIGSRAPWEVEILNEGSAPLTFQGEEPERPFEMDLPLGGLTIPVAGKGKITFTFLPTEPHEEPIERVVTLKSNELGAASYTFVLRGQGATPGLDCEPSPVDFGPVVLGATKKKTTICTNNLSVPIFVQIDGFSGRARDHFQAQIADPEAIPGEPYQVNASGTVEIEITFSAAAQEDNEAVLVLKDANPIQNELARVEVMAYGALSAIILEPSSCQDYGYVAVGESKTLAYTLRNIGTETVVVDRIELDAASAAEFSVATDLPISIAPDSVEYVDVVFQPVSGGKRMATLTFHTNDSRAEGATFTGCANAFGGGPQLVCTPTAIDFGMVAVDMPVTRTMRCTNGGFAPPGEVVDPLRVEVPYTTDDVFQATLRNPDGTEGPKPEGYAIDEFFFVDVAYNPVDEGFDRAEVIIESHAAPDGELKTVVAGQGRNLPPCQFELQPRNLEFGVVDRGASLVQSFTFKNTLGSESCLISDLRLTDDSDEAFSVTTVDNMELPAGEILKVPVTFAPTRYQPNVTGAVQFQISNRDESLQVVPLRGTAAKPCVEIDPPVVDFGAVGPGCQTRERFITISNSCPTPVTITAIEVNENGESDAFQISRRPNLPRILNNNEREEFGMVFAPDILGVHTGTLRVEAGSDWYLAELVGSGEEDATQTDTFNQKDRPKVDVLWVMDNSGSFSPYQSAISQNLPAFLTFANEQKVDFHIGVTTSGLTATSGCPGGANGGEDGRLFPIDGSHPRILTPQTPDLETHWRHNMIVGTCHFDEQYLEAARRALSEPLISSTVDTRYNSGYQDGNAGFLRKDASLSIIIVADEKDQSTSHGLLPAGYVDFFRNIKGPRLANMLRIHAITGPRAPEPRGACFDHGDRILDVVEETGGTAINLCGGGDWQDKLQEMSKGAFGFSARFFLRGQPGDANGDGRVNEHDILVKVDGFETSPVSPSRSKVWTYDPANIAVDFQPLFIPRPGAQLTATYKVQCLPKN
ncbi:MAG TPA: choice-of-anchor D domain-containing protein [Vulgatibacter sp.]|nr:choice-of-anchor D domain-containing protein [Vulgatibacter sp.]